MYRYFCLSGRHTFDGVEIMRYKISVPEFIGHDRISQFYREISERVQSFCEGDLKDHAKAEYERSEITNKKFRYPCLIYKLDGTVTYDGEEIAFVRMEATLKKLGDTSPMCRTYDAHTWSLSDECIIPPKRAASLLVPDKRLLKKIKSPRGVLYSDGKIFLCEKDSLIELSE